MKKAIICVLLLSLAITSFCQKSKLSKEDYLLKSKHQKSAAWVLLGGGTALMVTGFLIGNGKEASFDDAASGVIIAGIGVLSAIGSIPLFLASGKNKRKGMNLSFKNETAPQLFKGKFISHSYPSVAFKISL